MQLSKMTDIYIDTINKKEDEFFKYFRKPLHTFFSKNLGLRKKKFCKYVLREEYQSDEQMLNDTSVLYGKLSADLIRYLLNV